LPDCDAVVVADYGHGMLGRDAVEVLCRDARFLAATTQASAANFGQHTISRFPRADYFSLAQRELELECRDPTQDHESMLRSVIGRLSSRSGVVTFGQRGCLVVGPDGVSHSAPSLASRVVDRIGAGDAFFAISTLCAIQDAPSDILTFLGNLAGAESVGMVGNPERRAGASLVRSVESLLK
jgi:sugar/nucleoside kinase (ribokinase family)